MAITIYENPTPPQYNGYKVNKYNVLNVNNSDNTILTNLYFEVDNLDKNNDYRNVNIYYSFQKDNKWSGYVKFPNQKDFDSLKEEVSKVYQDAFDCAHPVGSIYTQYPYTPNPETMWGRIEKNGQVIVKSSWANISYLYNGAFFRSAGGPTGQRAEDFRSPSVNQRFDSVFGGAQPDSVPNLYGYFTEDSYSFADGSLMSVGNHSGDHSASGKGGAHYIIFNANNYNTTYGRRDEVAPRNFTINIWRRTL